MSKVSIIRQNFHDEVEGGINRQINMELRAYYIYLSMASYFDRADIALPGFSKFFKKSSEDQREHAEKLMKYLNKRGGKVFLQEVPKPVQDQWGSGSEALQFALNLEKEVNESILKLHDLGSQKNDPHFTDYLEGEFLDEQADSIREIGDMLTKINRVGPGLGEFLFDKSLQ